MQTFKLASAVLVSLALTVPVAGQTREKKVTEKDFPVLVKEASEAFDTKEFARSVARLRAAIQVAMLELEKVVIDADNALLVLESREFPFEFATGAMSVEITIEPHFEQKLVAEISKQKLKL